MVKHKKQNQHIFKYPVVVVTWLDAVGYGRKYDTSNNTETTDEIDKINIDGFLRKTVSVGILRKITKKALMVLQEYENLDSIDNTDFTVIPRSWVDEVEIIGWKYKK